MTSKCSFTFVSHRLEGAQWVPGLLSLGLKRPWYEAYHSPIRLHGMACD